jgi:lactate permease
VTWNQSYLLLGHGLAVSFVLATLPIVSLLILLGILRKPAWSAGLFSLAVAFLLAILAYHMPIGTAISAAGLGAAFGLFPITWIIFWAIALFRVTVEAGQFDVIRHSIARVTPDPRLQALLIAFAFGGFLEGAAGFGTPVAIAATMLVGLGFSPFSASAICLLANTVPVAFGSIGIPVVTLAATTGLSLSKLSADVGAICTPLVIVVPVFFMYAIGGSGIMAGIWLPTLLAGTLFGLTQLAVSIYMGPQLADILAALAVMVVLVVLFRFRQAAPGRLDASILDRFAHSGSRLQESSASAETRPPSGAIDPRDPDPLTHSLRQTLFAWMPYGLLVACVLLWGWAPLHRAMDRCTILLRWPWLHDVVRRMPPIVSAPSPYHAVFTLNWLSAAGTACMAATLLAVVFLRIHPLRFLRILQDVVRLLRLPTLTVVTVLSIAFLMNYCGATATLGLGFAATGRLFPLFSALLGWVGVFLTGSDTSSNALFGNLQAVTAGRLGFSPVLMAAANSAGGVMGKMISLQSIAIAAAATGLNSAEQVRLFRFTIRHSLLLALFTGCIVLLYVYVFHFS